MVDSIREEEADLMAVGSTMEDSIKEVQEVLTIITITIILMMVETTTILTITIIIILTITITTVAADRWATTILIIIATIISIITTVGRALIKDSKGFNKGF